MSRSFVKILIYFYSRGRFNFSLRREYFYECKELFCFYLTNKRKNIKSDAFRRFANQRVFLFQVFDKRNRGYITASDLRVVLQCLGENLSEEESK